MAIKVGAGKSKVIPEIDYNRVYITKFLMSQPVTPNTPKYRLDVEYMMYAIMPDGTKVFDESSKTSLVVEDYEQFVAEQASEGNMVPYNSMVSFEQGLASLLTVKLDIGTADVVPSQS